MTRKQKEANVFFLRKVQKGSTKCGEEMEECCEDDGTSGDKE